jgi:hypothetical protein
MNVLKILRDAGIDVQAAEAIESERGITTYLIGLKSAEISITSLSAAYAKLKTYGFVDDVRILSGDDLKEYNEFRVSNATHGLLMKRLHRR